MATFASIATEVVAYAVVGGLLLLVIFVVSLPYVWLIATHVRPVRAPFIALRIL